MTKPWLELNPPARRQWQTRPLPDRSIIVNHSSEGSFYGSRDWIQTRLDAGSYHRLFNIDKYVQLIAWAYAAYGARGWNSRTLHISGAMKAADWGRFGKVERDQWIEAYAWHNARGARWFPTVGLPMPAPVLLTRQQAEQPGASGLITHAQLDPTRRTDPGLDDAGWRDLLGIYAELTDQKLPTKQKDTRMTELDEFQTTVIMDTQRRLNALGYAAGDPDGIPGRMYKGATEELFKDYGLMKRKITELTEELEKAGINAADARDAARWRELVKFGRDLVEAAAGQEATA